MDSINNQYDAAQVAYPNSLKGVVQKRLAMSAKGVENFSKAIVWQLLQDITTIFPVMLVYIFIRHVYAGGAPSASTLTSTFLWQLLAIALVMLGLMLYIVYQSYMKTYTEVYRESANMRTSVAEHLRKLPLSFFDRRNASDLTQAIMMDVSFLENFYTHQLPQFCGSLLLLLLMCIGLPILDWRLALALLWVVPVSLLLLLLSRHLQYRVGYKGECDTLAVKEKIDEGFRQVQTILSCQSEERYLGELEEKLRKMEKSQLRLEMAASVVVNGIQTIIQLGLPTLIVVSSHLLLRGAVAFDTLLFFYLIATAIYQPLQGVLVNGSMLIHAGLKVDRMNKIYLQKRQEGSSELVPTSFDITFEDVSFAYNEGETVLDDISFVARQGETTALIGPSGGGKSTCARLASRFWDVDSGVIKLGGIDISQFDPETLLRYYAIVHQEVVLFNASVLDNIRIGRRDATDEEVIKAAQMAQCESFVKNLPNGYHTEIGENGSKLSGGERQRISIARAMLKNAPVVILDEATAAQDAENESDIQRAISKLIADKTVLIIAHRMRTIANVDKIVTIKEGRVAEQGTPSELLAQEDSHYRRMVELQQLAIHS